MTKLTLTIGDRTMTAEHTSDDLTVSELFELFRGVVIGHGYLDPSFINACQEILEE